MDFCKKSNSVEYMDERKLKKSANLSVITIQVLKYTFQAKQKKERIFHEMMARDGCMAHYSTPAERRESFCCLLAQTYYDLEILPSNMAFAVISMHSTYCQTLYFIFCIISRRLEKKFSDVRFEEQDILSKIKSTTLVLTSYCSS